MFNVSTIRHTAHIQPIVEFLPNVMPINLAAEMKTCFIAKHKTTKQIVIICQLCCTSMQKFCMPLGLQTLGIAVAANCNTQNDLCMGVAILEI